jgi:hypothetical protein
LHHNAATQRKEGDRHPQRLDDPLDPDPLVGGVGPFLSLQLLHGQAAGVVKADELPLLVEDRAARATSFEALRAAAVVDRRSQIALARAALAEAALAAGDREALGAG